MRRALVIVVMLCASGCDAKKPPKAGEVCKIEDERTSICSNSTNALYCEASKRRAIACRGPAGCAGSKPGQALAPVTCDTSVGREGDGCVEDDSVNAPVTCSEDKKSRLGCANGTRVLDQICRGPKGCDPTGLSYGAHRSCDRTLANAGDPCNVHDSRDEAVSTCSADGKTTLKCSDDNKRGVFVVTNICTGPKGCTVGRLGGDSDIPMAVCDRSVATIGAECGVSDSNFRSCTPDGTALLRCDSTTKRYAIEKSCGPKASCTFSMVSGVENVVCSPKR